MVPGSIRQVRGVTGGGVGLGGGRSWLKQSEPVALGDAHPWILLPAGQSDRHSGQERKHLAAQFFHFTCSQAAANSNPNPYPNLTPTPTLSLMLTLTRTEAFKPLQEASKKQ